MINKYKSYISKSHLDNFNVIKLKRPSWIKVKAPTSKGYISSKELVKNLNLNDFNKNYMCSL